MSVRLVRIAIGLFLVGLFLPALAVVQEPLLWGRPRDELWFGVQCLGTSMLFGPAALANAMLFCAMLMYAFGGTHRGRHVLAACIACVGLIAAMATPCLLGKMLRYPHAGYFAWVGSIATFAGACVARVRELAQLAASRTDRAQYPVVHARPAPSASIQPER